MLADALSLPAGNFLYSKGPNGWLAGWLAVVWLVAADETNEPKQDERERWASKRRIALNLWLDWRKISVWWPRAVFCIAVGCC